MTANTPETVAGGNPDKPWEWKPGQSGNPNGRPKDQFSFMGILRSVLAEENRSGTSVGERIIRRYVKLALAGNPQAAEALMARIDGKPAQSLTLKGDSAEPLHVRHSARLESSGPLTPNPALPAPEQAQDAAGCAYTTPGGGSCELLAGHAGAHRLRIVLSDTAYREPDGDTDHQEPDSAE